MLEEGSLPEITIAYARSRDRSVLGQAESKDEGMWIESALYQWARKLEREERVSIEWAAEAARNVIR